MLVTWGLNVVSLGGKEERRKRKRRLLSPQLHPGDAVRCMPPLKSKGVMHFVVLHGQQGGHLCRTTWSHPSGV